MPSPLTHFRRKTELQNVVLKLSIRVKTHETRFSNLAGKIARLHSNKSGDFRS